ncbi:MarR family transcriptional regulator [Bradyrhizobium sp. 200]|uniref:MarR family transcriptional regulator n=1 Tax=Bradyrhizobium sp. 200 TaxID=2782665 RepID=UPI001FFE839A|nr:MarR family transcriptional regulator [Bradyrhizobium sp. 200]UPJ48397.1 MarR family transcriptional regulator [Bradyrhizobium sp. 200]
MPTLLVNMLKGIYWFEDALEHALESNGLEPVTRAELSVVANIAMGEHRASKIAKNLGVSRQAISQILLGLTKRRMIVVKDDPRSRRSRIVSFSDNFQRDGEDCLRIFAELENELGRRIGIDRFRNLKGTLEAEWGEAPKIGRLPKLTSQKTGSRSKSKSIERKTISRRSGARAAGNEQASARRNRAAGRQIAP